ncbi:MAG: A/G-specific adenine glycosylase [Notoacmeibacter sp.]
MAFTNDLLNWYDDNARVLPWRVSPADRAMGVLPNPYFVWLSEIMLQQTTVKAVAPYFVKFSQSWPNVSSLAAADDNDVMAAWAGLGYYSRARNLKRCAQTIVQDFGGQFPQDREGLLSLPGIGDYTASAIASIAFNEAVVVMDGNVERVSARLLALETPLPVAKPIIRAFLEPLVPDDRPGDFAQAMMDLGATICTPKSPSCIVCPIARHCKAQGNDPARLPYKQPKAAKPTRKGAAFVAIRNDGAIWLKRRPAKGLLAGMAEVPTTGWDSRNDGATNVGAAPFAGKWQKIGQITHVFTHFTLVLEIYASLTTTPQGEGWWSSDLTKEALPSLMLKAIQLAQIEQGHKSD